MDEMSLPVGSACASSRNTVSPVTKINAMVRRRFCGLDVEGILKEWLTILDESNERLGSMCSAEVIFARSCWLFHRFVVSQEQERLANRKENPTCLDIGFKPGLIHVLYHKMHSLKNVGIVVSARI